MDHSQHESSHSKLALSATMHCLLGCGIGDIAGVIIGTLFGFTYTINLITGVLAGFIFGYLLGVTPLMKHMSLLKATKIIIATEFLSILVMEAGEFLTEWHFPGMRQATLVNSIYWLGLVASLLVGFIVAYPVNLYLVKKGIRHHH